MKPTVVSLFSGCGGMDLGLEWAGAKTIYACDIFGDALETLQANIQIPLVEKKDIRKITEFPQADIVIGGYPCQGFSLAGKRILDDPRNALYKEYKRTLEIVKPKFFIAENVKGLITMGGGEVIQQMIEEFEEVGYKVTHKLVNSSIYGVPQDRERVFIVGVRNDIDYTYAFPEATHGEGKIPFATMRDYLEGMEYNPEDMDQTGYSSRFLSRNRKRKWSDTSFTIQASGRHAPLHPEGEPMIKLGKDEWVFQGEINRKMTYKETARIQTFPTDYQFIGNLGNKYKMIGNAVPPLLAKSIAEEIVNYLKNTY